MIIKINIPDFFIIICYNIKLNFCILYVIKTFWVIIKKYNITSANNEIKDSALTCGHPQKLPYLYVEKIVARVYTKKNTPP